MAVFSSRPTGSNFSREASVSSGQRASSSSRQSRGGIDFNKIEDRGTDFNPKKTTNPLYGMDETPQGSQVRESVQSGKTLHNMTKPDAESENNYSQKKGTPIKAGQAHFGPDSNNNLEFKYKSSSGGKIQRIPVLMDQVISMQKADSNGVEREFYILGSSGTGSESKAFSVSFGKSTETGAKTFVLRQDGPGSNISFSKLVYSGDGNKAKIAVSDGKETIVAADPVDQPEKFSGFNNEPGFGFDDEEDDPGQFIGDSLDAFVANSTEHLADRLPNSSELGPKQAYCYEADDGSHVFHFNPQESGFSTGKKIKFDTSNLESKTISVADEDGQNVDREFYVIKKEVNEPTYLLALETSSTTFAKYFELRVESSQDGRESVKTKKFVLKGDENFAKVGPDDSLVESTYGEAQTFKQDASEPDKDGVVRFRRKGSMHVVADADFLEKLKIENGVNDGA